MEKINTDYKRRIWKSEAKLFNMCKPWLSSFNMARFLWPSGDRVNGVPLYLRYRSSIYYTFEQVRSYFVGVPEENVSWDLGDPKGIGDISVTLEEPHQYAFDNMLMTCW